MTTWVVVRTSVVGFHQWPDAMPGRSYLAFRHRHRFEVEFRLAVDHPDRAVEFHDLLGIVGDALADLALPSDFDCDGYWFGQRSCEQIALETIGGVRSRLSLPRSTGMRCAVFEDGENGAEVETP